MRKALLLLVLICVAGVLIWLLRAGERSGDAIERAEPGAAELAGDDAQLAPPPPDSPPPGRQELAPEPAPWRALAAEGGAVVRFDQRAEAHPRYHHSARASADGRFELAEQVAFGTWRVGVDGRQVRSPATVTLTEERPDAELRVELRRPEDVDAIEGLVFDEQGAPLRGVHVEPEPDQQGGGRMCRTDAEGRFRLERRGRSGAGPHRLRLSRDGYETQLSDEGYAWGARDLRFTMQRGLGVHVRVTERESGEPVLEYGLRLFPKFGSTNRRSSRDFELRALGAHEDGLAVLEGVERGPYQLIVETAGDAWVHPLFVELEVAAGTTFVPVQVEAPTLRTLRVESGGEPVAGTTVELLRPWEGEQVALDTRAVERDQLMGFGRSTALLVQRTTTDAAGEALLSAFGSAPYELRLCGGEHEPLVLHDVRLDAAPDPWVVEVKAGATLVGRLTPLELVGELREQAGLDVAGPVDAPDRDRLPGLLLSRGEWPNRQTHPGGLEKVALDDEGGFEIAGIAPGSWQVELMATSAHGGGGYSSSPEPVAEVLDLRAGEVRELVLDLPHWLRGTLRGRVWLDGEPFAGPFQLLAELEPDASGGRRIVNGRAQADAEGRYEALLRAASYRALIRVKDPATDAWLTLVSDETASVTSGAERELDLHVRTGHLRLRLVREDGSPIEGLSVSLTLEGLDLLFLESPPSDAEGRASLRAPVGLLHARTSPAHLRDPDARQRFFQEHVDDPDAWSRVVVDLGELLAGADPEPAEIEIRVPDDAGS